MLINKLNNKGNYDINDFEYLDNISWYLDDKPNNDVYNIGASMFTLSKLIKSLYENQYEDDSRRIIINIIWGNDDITNQTIYRDSSYKIVNYFFRVQHSKKFFMNHIHQTNVYNYGKKDVLTIPTKFSYSFFSHKQELLIEKFYHEIYSKSQYGREIEKTKFNYR